MEEVKRYFKNVESTIEKDLESAKELINLVINMPYYTRQPDGTYVEQLDTSVISSNTEIT